MPRLWLAVLVVAAGAAPAHADFQDDNFAIFARVERSAVIDTAAYALPAPSAYTYFLLGNIKRRELVEQRAFLVRCTPAECTGTPLWLGAGTIEVLDIVDLAGVPAPLPKVRWRRKSDRATLGEKGKKWPVLLVQTTEEQTVSTHDRAQRPVTGTQRHRWLKMISLVRADEKQPRIFDEQVEGRGATGAGFVTTVTFERGTGKTLEIVTSYQRTIDRALACLPPPAVLTRYRLGKDRRYVADTGAPHGSGCH